MDKSITGSAKSFSQPVEPHNRPVQAQKLFQNGDRKFRSLVSIKIDGSIQNAQSLTKKLNTEAIDMLDSLINTIC